MRERYATTLWGALAELGRSNLAESLREIVEALPLVVDVDCAAIRLADEDGLLYLVAASGCPAAETRLRALQPLEARVALRLLDSEALSSLASAHGFRWVDVRWLGEETAPVGSLLLASRTERRPQPLQLALLDEVAAALSDRMLALPERGSLARACALRLARSVGPDSSLRLVDEGVASLRPRERAILELYADGLTTRQIAALLVLSEHTVRTHVKTALRTLGVHSRGDAARLVRASQLGRFF